MDSNLQRIFSILIAVIIFFLFPIYVSFEKKDDISYSLALKMTYNFVENVRNKGYLSMDMYNDFVNQLSVTNNTYDISMQHVRKQYDPIFYVYTDNTLTKVDKKFDYLSYKNNYNASDKILTVGETTYHNTVLSYQESRIVNTEKQILDVLKRDNDVSFMALSINDYINNNNIPNNPSQYESNIYTMNAGDEFTVQLKNKNTTAATILFDALTLGASSSNKTRVYVNYGSTILNNPYKNVIEGLQIYNVDKTGKYRLEVWGASGGGNDPNNTSIGSRAGKGGYASGEVKLNEGDVLYIYVGGEGKGQEGGFNGGGNSHMATNGEYGFGGGGATDIRRNGQDTINRIIVAAGGGGADNATSEIAGTDDDGSGGNGGGTTGQNGYVNGSLYASDSAIGATLNSGYSGGGTEWQQGQGGDGLSSVDAGGGGGGYWGRIWWQK